MSKLAAILSFACCLPAFADIWPYPTTEIAHSRDGNIVVRIDPAPKVVVKNTDRRPIATLTKWNPEKKEFELVRQVTLRNPQSPVDVFVTNSAKFLITF